MARDESLRRLLQKRKSAAIDPQSIFDSLERTRSSIIKRLEGEKNLLLKFRGEGDSSFSSYKIGELMKRVTDLRAGAVKVHFAIREVECIQNYLQEKKGRPESQAEAQQRLVELSVVASEFQEDRTAIQEEAEPQEESHTRSTPTNVDLSLVTRLAGAGIRVGPMHFRLIAGQLERTYMNMVRITVDKEDTKKFVRALKRFFLPPGRTLEHVGITEKWLTARGFGAKEMEDLLS